MKRKLMVILEFSPITPKVPNFFFFFYQKQLENIIQIANLRVKMRAHECGSTTTS